MVAPHIHGEHEDCCHHEDHHELVVQDLSVRYRKVTALENISFATSCGNRIALVGPNGAGKSTLLKVIAGLVKRSTGTIQWRNTQVKKWSREFSYLPQREEIDWNFPITVRGLVEMGRYPQTGMFGKFTDTDEEAVTSALLSLQLEDLQHRQIKELSGGQQQRAFLARAIAQEAHILLLDEPFTGLDPNASELLGVLFHQLAKEGRLILSSHHDMNNVSELFNQTLLIDTQLVEFGKTEDVISASRIKEVFS